MTTFEFMTNAFYIMVGVACAAVALMVVLGVIAGIRRSFTRQSKKDKEESK